MASKQHTPAYNRLRKNWGLRKANKPQEGFHLSGVVKCLDRGGHGYIYVAFDEALVDAVAKILPRGVGPDDQAYLYVVQKQFGSMRYYMYARYVGKEGNFLLWVETQKPEWFSKVKRGRDNGTESSSETKAAVS